MSALQQMNFATFAGTKRSSQSPGPFIKGPYADQLRERSDDMLESMREAYSTAYQLAAVLQQPIKVFCNKRTGMYIASSQSQNPQQWKAFDRVDTEFVFMSTPIWELPS